MLARVLIANRGEAAVRLVRACHDAGAEAVAVYSTADRDGLWVRLADRAVCIGPSPAVRVLPEHLQPDRGGRDDRMRQRAPRLGLSGRERGVRAGLRRQRSDLRRPTRDGDRDDGRQERRQGRHAGWPGCRWYPARRIVCRGRTRRPVWPPRSATRCCSRRSPAAVAAACGWWSQTPRLADAYRLASAEAASAVRRRRHVPREGDHRSPPRRDAGARRPKR